MASHVGDDSSKAETDLKDAISSADDSLKARTDFTESGYDSSEEEADIEEDIYIGNAGLVLLSPYLTRYFEGLGLVEGRAFKDRVAAERGVHLLQFMLDGSSSNPEFLLVLNKILCGIKTGAPIIQSINIFRAGACQTFANVGISRSGIVSANIARLKTLVFTERAAV